MTQIVASLPPSTYNPALARSNAVRTLVDFAASFREQISYRTAVAGNGMGTLDVPATNRRIFVELGAAGGDVNEAQWDSFKPALGDVILLQRPRVMGLGGWIVIGWVKGDVPPCV